MPTEPDIRAALDASLEFVSFVHDLAKDLAGSHLHSLDTLLRFAMAIPMHIEEAAGQPESLRKPYLEIARGAALACAGSLYLLTTGGACSPERVSPGRSLLSATTAALAGKTERTVRPPAAPDPPKERFRPGPPGDPGRWGRGED